MDLCVEYVQCMNDRGTTFTTHAGIHASHTMCITSCHYLESDAFEKPFQLCLTALPYHHIIIIH